MNQVRYLMLADGTELWPQVALSLRDNYGIEPVLWIGHPRHLEFASRKFPDCTVINERKLDLGIFDRSETRTLPWLPSESLPLGTAARRAHYSLMRRPYRMKRAYLSDRIEVELLLEFLWYHLESQDVNRALASQIPHGFSGLLTTGLLEVMGIELLHFQQVNIGPFAIPRVGTHFTSFNEGHASVQAGLQEPTAQEIEVWVSRFASRFRDRLSAEREERVAKFEDDLRGFSGMVRNVRNKARESRQLKELRKDPGFVSEVRIPTRLVRTLMEERREVGLLRKSYARHCRPVSLQERFWFFPLHFEPEKSSMPDGGRNESQHALIRAISESAPDGVTLLVKEHPSQLMISKAGFKGRSKNFYDELSYRRNVRFVDVKIPTWQLLKRAEIVFTITGSIGLEAMLAGVPLVHFGEAWYRGLAGTFHCARPSQLDSVIEDALMHQPLVNAERFLVSHIASQSVRAVLTPADWRHYVRLGWNEEVDVAGVTRIVADHFAISE